MSSFADDLRRWLDAESSQRAERAQRAEPGAPPPFAPHEDGCARSAGSAREDDPQTAIPCSAALPSEFLLWCSAAQETYIERLGLADELHMDTSIGSEAETVARREARRIAAGIPADFPASRNGDLIDIALAAFQPYALTFIGSEPRAVPLRDTEGGAP
jgi:hypothetical protein